MAPASLPRVDRLLLAEVALPSWHPRAADGTCPVYADVVHHPDGPVLFDAGVASGHELIDRLYRPRTWPLADRLAEVGIRPADLVAVVVSHLHFDHCGQQAGLDAPTYVQAADVALVDAPRFTVPEWATVPPSRLRTLDGDLELADGLRVLATPGHTPGHQSLLVEGGGRRLLLAGQATYDGEEWARRETLPADVHDPSWHGAALASLERLWALRPDVVHLSHDPEPWRADTARST